MSQMYQSSSSTSSNPVEPQRRHTQLLMEFNQEMFKRNVLTDVECVVEGKIFQAHRALLICFSPYLKKKLLNADDKPIAKKIYIPKVGSSEFEILLGYMYSGSVQVDCNNFYDVYKAASILEMKVLKEECLQLLKGRNVIRTYFYSYVLSKKLGVESNWQKSLDLITHRFEETVFTKDFVELDLQFVVEILSAEKIGARSEIIVFLAALNWLNKDYASRVDNAVSVMDCVRFSSMSMEEILACFNPPFLHHVVQIREVLLMLYRATCYIAAKSEGKETWFKQYASPKRKLVLDSLPMKLWNKEQSRLVIVDQLDSPRTKLRKSPEYHNESWFPNSLKSYPQTKIDSDNAENKHPDDIDKMEWSHQIFPDEFKDNDLDKESAHIHRTGVDSVESSPRKEKSPPLVHGRTDGFPKRFPEKSKVQFSSPTKYRPQAKLKDVLDKEVVSPKNLSLESVLSGERNIEDNGCILVIGGMNPRNLKEDSGGSVRVFKVFSNEWVEFLKLPEPRHNHCSACLNNYLYVVGGCNSHETLKKTHYVPKASCFKLNLEETKWSNAPDLKFARFDHSMVVYKGRLVVIGGQDEKGRLLKTVEIYDPKQKHWNLLNSSMCCGRKTMGVAIYNDRIWIAGGIIKGSKNSQMEVISYIDCYHPDEDKWYFNIFSLPNKLFNCSLVEWGGKLYCIGGTVQISKGKPHTTDEVWFIDGENQSWKRGPSLPEPRMGGTALTYEKNLYYLGGFDPDNDSNMSNIIFLTPGAASWSIGLPMTSETFGLSAVCYKIT